jgi:hypothetical protein
VLPGDKIKVICPGAPVLKVTLLNGLATPSWYDMPQVRKHTPRAETLSQSGVQCAKGSWRGWHDGAGQK